MRSLDMLPASLMPSSFPPNAHPHFLTIFALAVLGLLAILRPLSALASWSWRHFLRPGMHLSRYGSWAVVTGCTDGIGRGFCFQLARRRLNLLLLGRSQEKLETLASHLKTKYSVQVQFVVLDFLDPDLDAGLSRVKDTIAGLDVGILINNAGQCYPYARFFHEVDAKLTADLIRVNVEAAVKMVQIVLPGMINRKRGAIVNIGSGAASILASHPLYALYTGTKGFIEKFSRNLYVEYKHSGVDVQVQVPLLVATKLASIRRPSFFCPSPDAYARSAVRWIGYEPVCTPYWTHSLLWKLVDVLPERLVDAVRLRAGIDLRRRGKLKESRKKRQ